MERVSFSPKGSTNNILKDKNALPNIRTLSSSQLIEKPPMPQSNKFSDKKEKS